MSFPWPLGCTELLSEVDVAGVVADDANVEDDFLRDTLPLAPFVPFALPCRKLLPCFSGLISALDLRRRLLRKEGMTNAIQEG